MLMTAVSEKEEKFKEEICNRLWCAMVDILEEEGIDVFFLSDSKDITFALETIENRIWFWKEHTKKNKELIKQHNEGKKLDALIDEEENQKKELKK